MRAGECMGNSKHVLRRSISLLRGKIDRLHALIILPKELMHSKVSPMAVLLYGAWC